MKLLNFVRKILGRIDRDRVAEIEESYTAAPLFEYHEMIEDICDKCQVPKLYKVGIDRDYILHCFKCGKEDRVVSL